MRATGLLIALVAVASASSVTAQTVNSIAQAFADTVISVEGSGADLRLRLAPADLVHPAPIVLRIGQSSAQGWKLTALTQTTATLTKGGETQVIGLTPVEPAASTAGGLTASVIRNTPDIDAQIAAGAVTDLQQESATPAQIWAGEHIAAQQSKDTNLLRQLDGQDPQGPDKVLMGSVYPGGVGPDTPGAPPGFISLTGYVLGQDAQGRYTFYRTAALARADGNKTPDPDR